MVGDKKRRVWEKETIHWRCQQASGPTEISGWIYSLQNEPTSNSLKGIQLVLADTWSRERKWKKNRWGFWEQKAGGTKYWESITEIRASARCLSFARRTDEGKISFGKPRAKVAPVCTQQWAAEVLWPAENRSWKEWRQIEKCVSLVLRVIKEVLRDGRKPHQTQSIEVLVYSL